MSSSLLNNIALQGFITLVVFFSFLHEAAATCSEKATISDPDAVIPNNCLYGACSQTNQDLNPLTLRCVHDNSFCFQGETFIEASDVLKTGRECKCTDILDFPNLIGACETNGVISPMVLGKDCPAGESLCKNMFSPIGARIYTIGDDDYPFTACDLTCDHYLGHEHKILDNTYNQCAVPAFEWVVASSSPSGTFSAKNIVSTLIDGKSVIIVGGEMFSFDGDPLARDFVETVDEVNLRGPYTPSDPTGVAGTVNINHDILSYGGRRPYEMGFGFIDGDTGQPLRITSIEGNGTQYVNAMAIGGPDRQSVVAGGDHAPLSFMKAATKRCTTSLGVAGGANTICEVDAETDDTITTLTGHEVAFVAPLVSFSAVDGSVNWMIQPWLDLSQAETGADYIWYEVSITGLAMDTVGDVYVFGHKALQAKENAVPDPGINGVVVAGAIYKGTVSKFAAADGREIWRKEFPSTKHAVAGTWDETGGDAIFVTFEMQAEVETPDELGVTCKNPANGGCSILARLSATDGTVEWSRFAHGNYGRPWNVGGARLAKESDGPYVYAAFQRAGVHGPTSLDTGTNYGGCVDPVDDNTIIPEYSNVFDGGIVNQDVCTAQGLGAYVNRTSSQSIPAYAANTGVHCSGSSASSCLAKFHKNSGLPVWAIPKPDIFDFETTEDGIVVVGTTYDSPPSFDSVQIAAGVATLEGYGVMWQSKVDLNGNGIYVQPLISERSYGGGTGLTQDPNGNLFMTLYTTSPTTKLGPGAPGGWTLDLMTDVCGEEDAICEGEQRNLVTKLGDEMTPSCIASCGEDIEVTADNCFIDGVCYANGDSAIAIGLGCMVCNSAVSQTEWSEGPTIGTTACLIYNKCFADGTLLEVRVGRFEAVYSECQVCIPSTNKYDWSIKEEYDLVSVSAVPPEDCSFKPTSIPTDDPTMAPVSPSTNFPTKNPVLAPTDKPIVSEEVGLSKASESSNDDDSLSNGAIAAIVFGCLVGFGVFAFFMAKRATGNNIEYQTNQ